MNTIRRDGARQRHQLTIHFSLQSSIVLILALFFFSFFSGCGSASSPSSGNPLALLLNHPYEVKGVTMKVMSIDMYADKARVPDLGDVSRAMFRDVRIICSFENKTTSAVDVNPALFSDGSIAPPDMINGTTFPFEDWTETLQPHQKALFEFYFQIDPQVQQFFNLSVTSLSTVTADYQQLFVLPQPGKVSEDSTNQQTLQLNHVYKHPGMSMTVKQVASQKTLNFPNEDQLNVANTNRIDNAARFIHIISDVQNTTGEDMPVWPIMGSAKLAEREDGEITGPLMINGTITIDNSQINLPTFLIVHAHQTVHLNMYFMIDTMLANYQQLAYGFVLCHPGPNRIQPDPLVIPLASHIADKQ